MLSKAEIKYIKALNQKKFRQERKEFIIEGKKIIAELLAAPGPFVIKRLFLQEGVLDARKAPIAEYVSASEMERISAQSTPSGALALVGIPDIKPAVPQKGDLYLALDGVQDPGNFGTILRLADWFNIAAVYASPDCVELYNPKTVQSTMGAILRVPVYYTSLETLLKETQLPVLGTVLQGGMDINTLSLPSDGIVVMGNESRGISPGLPEYIQTRLFIPAYREGSESLNVAIAAAIVCATFRRNLPPLPR
ncbi:MAG TPA: RNA methyltransferase [Bacteroidales bacterium]|nr:RNA methyltransferase [Bacteroidales bacterium]